MSEPRLCAYPVCGRWFTVEPEDEERPMVYPYRQRYCSWGCYVCDKRRREVIGEGLPTPIDEDACGRGENGR